MAKPYKVWIEIEGTEPPEIEKILEDPVPLAEFDTWEEAVAFKTEIEHRYAPLVTGESEVIDELLTPDILTPGD